MTVVVFSISFLSLFSACHASGEGHIVFGASSEEIDFGGAGMSVRRTSRERRSIRRWRGEGRLIRTVQFEIWDLIRISCAPSDGGGEPGK
ncbi:hypothetical protein [Streptosporangium saharense]|uniref:Secreted protein n=1 Tax=Streptosporangium saharense TaxID=1706840 RepID=A0A7W7QTJ9_9ACTN|nr:hypothetical protein [Streptosporangium saharense]MBB4918941.1 hypothetical protein [Streptosporangium saharense]